MKILQFVTDSLGDAAYLAIAGGSAIAVDPQRDVRPLRAAAAEHGASIDYVFETHVHNDYISGGRELAALGAQVVAAAGSGLEFPHLPVKDGDDIRFGGAALRAVAAPGHTYHHTAYLALDEAGKTNGAFTGGAMLMAAVGRTDLLGPEHTDELTRLQWETAQRLAEMLSPEAEILPTHGAGSFCSATGIGMDRRGLLLTELGRNPAFTAGSFDAFRAIQLGAAAPTPGYYQYMSPINRRGPTVYGEPPVPARLAANEVVSLLRQETTVVDVRTRFDFAHAHIPGSVEIEESGSALAYVGWLVPFNAPLALVTYDEAQARRMTVDLFRIGYEQVVGYLSWSDWQASGRETGSVQTVDREEARRILREKTLPVVDMRYENEHAATPLAGALEFPIDKLPAWREKVPEGALLVCGSGQRATMGASFLPRGGRQPVVLIDGGAGDLV